MIRVSLLLILICLFTSSCNQVIYALVGLKTPRFETVDHISKTMKKFGIDDKNAIIPKDTLSYFYSSNLFAGSPQIVVFNKDGYKNEYYPKNISCPGPVENYLVSICNNQPAYVDSIKQITILNDNFKYISGNNFQAIKGDDDVSIFIQWTVYQNKMLKKKVEWQELIKQHLDCKYSIYWVNTDYRGEFYGINKREKIKVEINAKRSQ